MANIFKYWFRHWKAYQMIALKHKCWRFRFILHDIKKPFQSLIYNKSDVREMHRKSSKHHIEYNNYDYKNYDYLGMLVDWECARFTKPDKPLNAIETYRMYLGTVPFKNNSYALWCFQKNMTKYILKYKF